MNPQRGIALFDLDHTLLGGDATYEWMQFLMRRGIVERADCEPRLDRFYEDYGQGSLDIHAFLRFDFEPLARHSRSQLEAWRDEYLAESIAPILLPKAHELIAWHHERGDITAIVTAANSFITAPIARLYGAQHLLASEPAVDAQGEFTGEVAGEPCFHDGKVTRLAAWLAERGDALADFSSSHFYGDSQSDVPLLALVTHPVVVHPDAALAELAGSRGWPIISLR